MQKLRICSPLGLVLLWASHGEPRWRVQFGRRRPYWSGIRGYEWRSYTCCCRVSWFGEESLMIKYNRAGCSGTARVHHDRRTAPFSRGVPGDPLHRRSCPEAFAHVRHRSHLFVPFVPLAPRGGEMNNVNRRCMPRSHVVRCVLETRLSGPVAWAGWVAVWEDSSIGAGSLPAERPGHRNDDWAFVRYPVSRNVSPGGSA
jgi:hypothetical protein